MLSIISQSQYQQLSGAIDIIGRHSEYLLAGAVQRVLVLSSCMWEKEKQSTEEIKNASFVPDRFRLHQCCSLCQLCYG